MRAGNLPFAVEVVPDLADLPEVLDFIQKQFRINNVDQILEPHWSLRLL